MTVADQLTPEKVRAGVARARGQLERFPEDLRPFADGALGVIDDQAEEVAGLGQDLLTEGVRLVQTGRPNEARLLYVRHYATADEALEARRAARLGSAEARRQLNERRERMADAFLDLLGKLVIEGGPIALHMVAESFAQ